MSYDVSLMKDGKVVEVERHEEGGTYAVGGTTEAYLNVTWNYSKFYKQLSQELGLKWLDHMTARNTLVHLSEALSVLGCKRDKDYWAATPGNAGWALLILHGWAVQHLDAVWEVV